MTVEPFGEPLVEDPFEHSNSRPLANTALAAELETSKPRDLVEEPEDEHNAGRNLARATTLLAFGNIASRVLGFVREILLSNFFGPSRAVDAYQIALTIPQDLYDLAISGHLNSALVPTMSEYAATDRQALWRLVNLLLGLVFLGASGITLVLVIFAPQVITLYRGVPMTPVAAELSDFTKYLRYCGFDFCATTFTPEAFDLSVQLLRITSPALIFLAMFAILSGALLSLRRFFFPAFAAALFNGVLAIGIIFLVPVIGIHGAALGWVLGGIAQMALQLGGLRGVRIWPAFGALKEAIAHPGVRRIGLLYVPVMFSLILDVLINRPFSYTLASQSGDGSIAYMNWATSLREFPMGLVGTAISLAILPTLARLALRPDQRNAFKDTLGQGIRLALTLIIPATVGMFVLAGPLIGLMFERGAFTSENTLVTAQVLRLYLLGIPFAAVDLLLVFAFYAQKDSFTPAAIGIFSLAAYIGIASLLHPYMGFYALMVADSLKHLIHTVIAWAILRRRLGGMGGQKVLITLTKVILATTVMGLVTWLLARSIVELLPINDIRQRLLLVGVPTMLGGAMYVLLASLLRLNELNLFLGKLRQKIK